MGDWNMRRCGHHKHKEKSGECNGYAFSFWPLYDPLHALRQRQGGFKADCTLRSELGLLLPFLTSILIPVDR